MPPLPSPAASCLPLFLAASVSSAQVPLAWEAGCKAAEHEEALTIPRQPAPLRLRSVAAAVGYLLRKELALASPASRCRLLALLQKYQHGLLQEQDVPSHANASSLSEILVLAALWDAAGGPALQTWRAQMQRKYAKGIAAWRQRGNSPSIPPGFRLTHHERPVLPVPGERNVLITSALPYVNNVPHLGNIIGCVLSADVYARYCRLRGDNVMFVCGTDEYGTATETKAIEEGTSCQALCDKYHAIHKRVYEWFDIDFNHFGRTTTAQQTAIAQGIFHQLDAQRYAIQQTITQLYCETHKSFLADRFVEGTCPLCSYADARGDQCDACGKLLNAVDLIRPHCKLDGAVPVLKDSTHLFLDLTRIQPQLERWVDQASQQGHWSSNSLQITRSWLREGLKPRCITRDLHWGTPVPRPGFEAKVFYVWFDAPIGYLSITAAHTPDWERWWKNPRDVKLYQFMGKDNVPFHSVIFPSTLLATGTEWTLLHHLSTTEYLQYEGGKFSKSRGVGVFGNNVMDSGIPVAVWRYYLLANRPESSDSQFTWSAFVAANNAELLGNLGNFVNRVVKFVNAKYGSVVPAPSAPAGTELDTKLRVDVQAVLTAYIAALDAVKIRQGLRSVMELSSLGNTYLQDNKLDNTLFAGNPDRCNAVVYHALNLMHLLALLAYPYLPSTSAAILRMLQLPLAQITDAWVDAVHEGHAIGKAEYLFTRIEASREEQLRATYGGGAAGAGASTTAAPALGKAKKSANKPGPASKADTPAQGAKSALSPERRQELEEAISTQGNVVRALKAGKAPPADIKAAVEVLLALKAELAA